MYSPITVPHNRNNENTIENTNENPIENAIENAIENTNENTNENTIENAIENTIENTIENANEENHEPTLLGFLKYVKQYESYSSYNKMMLKYMTGDNLDEITNYHYSLCHASKKTYKLSKYNTNNNRGIFELNSLESDSLESDSLESNSLKSDSFESTSLESNLQAIRNIKVSNENIIKSISLELNCCIVDKIYTSTFDIFRNIYNVDKDVIPFHLAKNGIPISRNIKIYIDFNDNIDLITCKDLELTFDVYNSSLNLNDFKDNVLILPLFQTDTLNERIYKKISLWDFGLTVYHLIIESEYDGDYKLNIGMLDFDLIRNKKIGNVGLYSLTPSMFTDDIIKYGLNFQRDRINLLVTDWHDYRDKSITIHAIRSNLFHFENNGVCVVYST